MTDSEWSERKVCNHADFIFHGLFHLLGGVKCKISSVISCRSSESHGLSINGDLKNRRGNGFLIIETISITMISCMIMLFHLASIC